MSSIVLPTRALVGLLADLALTASVDPEAPALCSILLHADSGEYLIDLPDDGDDHEEYLFGPMETGLLVGTSTDRGVIAQAHTACEEDDGGGLTRPVLLATSDAKALVKVFKPLVSSLGKERTHRVELAIRGEEFTVREDPHQVPAGTAVSVPSLQVEEFPPAWSAMTPDPGELVPDKDGVVEPASYGHAFAPRHLEAFGKIGKRRGMPVRIYRHHQRRGVVAEVGASYRATVSPTIPRDETELSAPMVRVFVPELATATTARPVR